MGWTPKQRQIAARAAKQAGLSDEHRKLILRQCEGRAVLADGSISSTAQRLNQSDFEHYMATVESFAGGKVAVGGRAGQGFSDGYWAGKASDDTQRLRHLAVRIANWMTLTDDAGNEPLLTGDGVGLASWISKRVTNGRTDDINELSSAELHVLINGLRAFARRHGRKVD